MFISEVLARCVLWIGTFFIGEIFDTTLSIDTFLETKVDFGQVPLETKNEGRIRLKHSAGLSITHIWASCGCSTPIASKISESETEIRIQIRTYKVGDIRSSLKVELSDGSVRVVNLAGSFRNAITVSPKIVEIAEDEPFTLVFDWSATRMAKPTIRCEDDRFHVNVIENIQGKSTVAITLAKQLGRGEIAFVTDIGFVFSEGERSYQTSVPVKRSRPNLIIPSVMYVDDAKKPVRLLVVTDKQSSMGRTGRCRLRSLTHESVLVGSMEKERESSITLQFPVDRVIDSVKADSDRFAVEMEFKSNLNLTWKEIGVVAVKFR